MDAITAVVLGGVSISGGKGNIWLVVVGVLIMGTLSVGMIMNNINDYVQQVIKGAVLIGISETLLDRVFRDGPHIGT